MEDALSLPGKIAKPTRWAIWNDLFHPAVPWPFIGEAYTMILENPRHTFLVLTKQAKRMYEWHKSSMFLMNEPLPNLWLGITAENQIQWDIRSSYLKAIPAALKWVSFEPLLGPINIGIIDSLWLDWAVVGGESGPGARPCDLRWVENLRWWGSRFGIPIFVKQLHKEGRLIKNMQDFPESLKIREFPKRMLYGTN
jgi:protein gp37